MLFINLENLDVVLLNQAFDHLLVLPDLVSHFLSPVLKLCLLDFPLLLDSFQFFFMKRQLIFQVSVFFLDL